MLRHYVREAARAAIQLAFARRRFKLLLRTTLRNIDLRTQAVCAATNFFSSVVQPVVINAPFGASMLVLAPHQDDEVIGCGGAMALQRRSGAALRTVVLHDGADEHAQVTMTRDTLREMRNEESKAAARVIGAEEPVFLGSKCLRDDAQSITATLTELIETLRIDALFTPFVLDGHPDHRMCNEILARALTDVGRQIRVFQYEVWALCIPNVALIIDDVMEKKEAMLSCFHFANAAHDYAHTTKGLNMFQSRLLPAGKARFVEAFFETPVQEYLEIVNAVTAAEQRAIQTGVGIPGA